MNNLELNLRCNLPHKLFKAEQVRAYEAAAAANAGIAMYDLMESAGQAVFSLVCQHFPRPSAMTVLCGYGNNGGDGYVIARLAKVAGWQVKLLQLGSASKLSADAANAKDKWLQYGGKISQFEGAIPSNTVIIDAMLGTGLNGPVRGAFAEAIALVNQQTNLGVFSVDIPSGLDADTGQPMGEAIIANQTCTFVAVKAGLLTGHGPDYCGQLSFCGLEIAAPFEQLVPATAITLDIEQLPQKLPIRKRVSHKGQFGHVLLIGGNVGMSGAIRMAAKACLRVGAGLVSVCTHPENYAIVAADCPEIMLVTEPLKVIEKVDVIVFGPGAGQDLWAQNLLHMVLGASKPLVIDADGLNLLAKAELDVDQRRWILTPHPKEAARLLKLSVAEIQTDRFTAVDKMVQQYEAVVLLKGAGSVIADKAQTIVNTSGNPGMATAGMGDILSGIIGGLLAQGLSLIDAAAYGALIHGIAGDMAARDGERGLMATDLLNDLRSVVNGKSKWEKNR